MDAWPSSIPARAQSNESKAAAPHGGRYWRRPRRYRTARGLDHDRIRQSVVTTGLLTQEIRTNLDHARENLVDQAGAAKRAA
jgi:hypothetical protein